MMRRRPIWTTNTVAFMVGVAQFAGFVLIPQYVQEPPSTGFGFGASPLASGLFLLPMTIGVLLIGLAAGPLERRFGARALLVGGNLVTMSSFVLLTFFRDSALEVFTASALLGVGTGVAMAALATLIVTHVDRSETGAAAGVNNVARTLGGAIGAQIAAALLAAGAGAGGLHDPGAYTLAFAVGLAGIIVATMLGPLLPGRLEEPTGPAGPTARAAPELAYRR